MLVNSSYYYGKQNGAVVERYVLDGIALYNVFPFYTSLFRSQRHARASPS